MKISRIKGTDSLHVHKNKRQIRLQKYKINFSAYFDSHLNSSIELLEIWHLGPNFSNRSTSAPRVYHLFTTLCANKYMNSHSCDKPGAWMESRKPREPSNVCKCKCNSAVQFYTSTLHHMVHAGAVLHFWAFEHRVDLTSANS